MVSRVLAVVVTGLLAMAGVGVAASAAPVVEEGRWSAAGRLPAKGMGSRYADLEVAADGFAVATWPTLIGCNGCHAAWRLAERLGGSWSSASNLPAVVSSVDVGFTPDGAGWLTFLHDGRVWVAERSPGTRFGAPVALTAPGVAPSASVVAVGGDGQVAVSWTRPEAGGTAWDIAERRADGTWSTSTHAAAASPVSDDLGITPAGDLVSVYDDAGLLSASVRRNGTWGPPYRLSTGLFASGQAFPGIDVTVVRAAEQVMVVWQRTSPSFAIETASFDGQEWRPTRQISDSTSKQSSAPVVVVDSVGRATVAWQRIGAPKQYVEISELPSGMTGKRVSGSKKVNVGGFDVAVAPSGSLTVAWAQADPQKRGAVRVKHLPVGGGWTDPVDLRHKPGASGPNVELGAAADGRVTLLSHNARGAVQRVFTPPAGVTRVNEAARGKTFRNPATFGWATSWGDAPSHDVRYREAGARKKLGEWNRWLTDVSQSSASTNLAPGATRCVQARGRLADGQTLPWSRTGCTTRPIDDSLLKKARGPWRTADQAHAFEKSLTSSRRKGSQLVFKALRARSIAVVVRSIPKGGKLRVSYDGRDLGVVDLRWSNSRSQHVVPVKTFRTEKRGKLALTVVSRTGKLVRVDGIIAER